MDKRETGNFGEELAERYLKRRWYRILERQYRCRFGEIDLIARKGGILCFVEVKTRSSVARGLPRDAVDQRKQQRLRKTAALYLAERGLDCPVRFDVAEVYLEEGKAPRIEYLENAF